ncbi:MAG TPA: hypothetical protein VGK83_01620 [Acidimicrobiia bacterium]
MDISLRHVHSWGGTMRNLEEHRLITVKFEFSGELWYWRGPAPFHFIPVPENQCEEIKDLSSLVTY